MKRTGAVFIHILCWTLILLYRYGGYLLKDNLTFTAASFDISMIVVQIVEFYFCYLLIFPKFMKRKTIPLFILGILSALVLFAGLRYLIEEVIYLALFNFHNYSSDTPIWSYFMDNVYFGTSYIVFAGAAWGVGNAFETEKSNTRLKDEAKKAELAFLKSQINPHFLYNSLNYIYSLAMPVSDKMANAVLRLSALMRYTLNDNAEGKVKLVDEIDYLESYIELFKMRFEPNFYVEFIKDGVNESQCIAALILIPFLENAFKHGIVNDPAHPVRLYLKVHEKQLYFEVSNKISHMQKDHSSGIGLVNTHRRLDLIYPNDHELTMHNNNNEYKITLTIPISHR